MLFSGSLDHHLLAWSTNKGEVLTRHKFGTPVFSLYYNAKLDHLYAGGDGGVYVYTIRVSGKPRLHPVVYFGRHSDFVTSVTLGGNGRIYSAGYDNQLCAYEQQNLDNIPDFLHEQTVHERGVTAMDIDPVTNTLITGSWDKTVKVWATDQRKAVRHLQSLEMPATVTSLAYVHSTASVWVTVKNYPCLVFDPRTGTNLTEFLPRDPRLDDLNIVKVIAVDQGQMLIGCTDTRQIIVWRYNAHAAISVMHGHTDWVEVVKFFPNQSTRMISGGCDAAVRMWDSPSHMYPGLLTTSAVMHGHKGSILCVALTDDEETLITGSDDKTVRVWSVTENPEKLTLGDPCKKILVGHTARVTGVIIIDHLCVSASWDQSLRVWDINTGSPAGVLLHAHDTAINGLALGDNEQFATCSGDRVCYVWELPYTDPLVPVAKDAVPPPPHSVASLVGHEADVTHIAWNTVHKGWVTASDDMTVRMWKPDGTPWYSLPMSGWDGFTALGVDLGNGWCMVGLKDNTLCVVDLVRGIKVQEHRGHCDAIRDVVHAPDKNLYITASWDHTIRVWRAFVSRGKRTAQQQQQQQQQLEDEEGETKELSYAERHPIFEPKSLGEAHAARELAAQLPTRPMVETSSLTVLDMREQAKRTSRCSQLLAEVEASLNVKYPFLQHRGDKVPVEGNYRYAVDSKKEKPGMERLPPRSRSTEPTNLPPINRKRGMAPSLSSKARLRANSSMA